MLVKVKAGPELHDRREDEEHMVERLGGRDLLDPCLNALHVHEAHLQDKYRQRKGKGPEEAVLQGLLFLLTDLSLRIQPVSRSRGVHDVVPRVPNRLGKVGWVNRTRHGSDRRPIVGEVYGDIQDPESCLKGVFNSRRTRRTAHSLNGERRFCRANLVPAVFNGPYELGKVHLTGFEGDIDPVGG